MKGRNGAQDIKSLLSKIDCSLFEIKKLDQNELSLYIRLV